MKKIYAILVAALMSVSLFAAPTQGDLAGYLEEGYYVACFQAPVGTTCNDIYWMGEYCDWNISTPLEDLVKCEALTGANEGWYVAKVPADKGDDGKPIQLNECGKLTWDVQPSNAPIEVVAGSVTVDSKDNGESDLKDWSTEEATIITITSWKGDYNPCEKVCEAQSYTIRIYPPYCEDNDEFEPTIKGSFNQWGDAITMEFKGSYFEYVSDPVTNTFEFKFNNDPAGSWSNQFEAYDEDNDTWSNVPAAGNFSLTNGTEFYTLEGNVLTFDFSGETEDGEPLFRYAQCGVSSEAVDVLITLKAPAGVPAAGIEVAGDFASADWSVFEAMELGEDGAYTATINASAGNVFKFREAGSWDNEIVYIEPDEEGKVKGLENMKVGEKWNEADHTITLDFSDPAVYTWKAIWTSVENVVLTEKAQKVVIDGTMYIIRNNKLFNVQGTQVR